MPTPHTIADLLAADQREQEALARGDALSERASDMGRLPFADSLSAFRDAHSIRKKLRPRWLELASAFFWQESRTRAADDELSRALVELSAACVADGAPLRDEEPRVDESFRMRIVYASARIDALRLRRRVLHGDVSIAEQNVESALHDLIVEWQRFRECESAWLGALTQHEDAEQQWEITLYALARRARECGRYHELMSRRGKVLAIGKLRDLGVLAVLFFGRGLRKLSDLVPGRLKTLRSGVAVKAAAVAGAVVLGSVAISTAVHHASSHGGKTTTHAGVQR